MRQWLLLALRNVRRNGRRSLLLGGTIAVGTLALLLFVCYIAASLDGLRESTIRSGLGHAQLAAPGQFDGYAEQQLQFGLDRAAMGRLEAALAQEPQVRRVVPRLQFSGLVSNGPRTLNFEGSGVMPDRERQAFGAFQSLAEGRALNATPEGRYQVLIGREMARRLGVRPGQSITLMTTTASGSVNAMDLEIVGLVATGVPQSDLYLLQLPLETAQELLRSERISSVALLYQASEQADAVSARLRQRLGAGIELKTWQQLAPLYSQVLALFRNQFVAFGVVIGMIVFLGVAAMTLTTIYERAREIGTMRAMGIGHATVRRLFVFEGMLQGALGALAGAALAFAATLAINAARIELAPPPGRNVGVLLQLLWVPEYGAAVVCALPLVAMLAAWTVSRRIARMPIMQSLSIQ
jgi:putative ABC transport system permease protein